MAKQTIVPNPLATQSNGDYATAGLPIGISATSGAAPTQVSAPDSTPTLASQNLGNSLSQPKLPIYDKNNPIPAAQMDSMINEISRGNQTRANALKALAISEGSYGSDLSAYGTNAAGASGPMQILTGTKPNGQSTYDNFTPNAVPGHTDKTNALDQTYAGLNMFNNLLTQTGDVAAAMHRYKGTGVDATTGLSGQAEANKATGYFHALNAGNNVDGVSGVKTNGVIGTSGTNSDGVDMPDVSLLPVGAHAIAPTVKAVNDPNNSIAVRTSNNQQTAADQASIIKSGTDLANMNQATAANLNGQSYEPNSNVANIGQASTEGANQIAAMAASKAQADNPLNPDGTEKSLWQRLADANHAITMQYGMERARDQILSADQASQSQSKSLAAAIANNDSQVVNPEIYKAAGALNIAQQNANIANSNQDISRAADANSANTANINAATNQDNAATQRINSQLTASGLEVQQESDKNKKSATDQSAAAVTPAFVDALGQYGYTFPQGTTLQQVMATTPDNVVEAAKGMAGRGGSLGNGILESVTNGTAAGMPMATTQAMQPWANFVSNVRNNAIQTNPNVKAWNDTISSAGSSKEQVAAAQTAMNNYMRQAVQDTALAASQGDPKAVRLSGGLYGLNTTQAVVGDKLANGTTIPAGLTKEQLSSTNSVDLINHLADSGMGASDIAGFFSNLADSSHFGVDYQKAGAPKPLNSFPVTLVGTNRTLDLSTPAGVLQYQAWLKATNRENSPPQGISETLGNMLGITPQMAEAAYNQRRQSGQGLFSNLN